MACAIHLNNFVTLYQTGFTMQLIDLVYPMTQVYGDRLPTNPTATKNYSRKIQ